MNETHFLTNPDALPTREYEDGAVTVTKVSGNSSGVDIFFVTSGTYRIPSLSLFHI